MNEERRRQVIGNDGMIGWIDDANQPVDRPERTILLEDGQSLIVPENWLQPQADGTYFIPMSRGQLDAAAWTQVVSSRGQVQQPAQQEIRPDVEPRSQRNAVQHVHTESFAQQNTRVETDENVIRGASEAEHVIPVVQEEAVITKRVVAKGRVRVNKHVHEREEVVDDQGMIEEVVIERVQVGQIVDKSPGVRYEGETMIIPVLEEVLVVEKRLRVKEEVRITKQTRPVNQPQTVRLRTEEIEVEHLDPKE